VRLVDNTDDSSILLKPRTINSVKSRFKKVISTRQLRRWEKQINVSGSRKVRQISAYTLDKFTETVRKGAIIHDIDITRWLCKRNDKKLIRF